MNFDYDVAIIGAGPIGSTLAYKLANEGLNVCLIDKKKCVGLPLQCAGIVSSKIFDCNEVPQNIILNEVKGANLYSRNYDLKVSKGKTEAFVIDRVAYDQFLFNRACNVCVDNFLSSKVIDVNVESGLIKYTKSSESYEISAKVIVGADGPNSVVSSNLDNDYNYFNASQFLVKVDSILNKDLVNVYAKEGIFPGFIWAIPTYDDIFRVGIFSNHSYKQQAEILNNFLENDFQRISHNNQSYEYDVIEKYIGKIPIFNKKNLLVKDRAILIGDAACQVKPTTGGGLIIGFNSCKLAKKHILNVFNNQLDSTEDIRLLKNYQKEFLNMYSKEFSYQFKVQKTLSIFSDDDIDYFFVKLKENDCEELISQYGDMDHQSLLVKKFLKKGFIFSLVPKLMKKELFKIWL